MNLPRPIGFWYYPYDGGESLPKPNKIVRPGWISGEDRAKLVKYLRAGATYESWRGLSYCRFHCGIDDREMGFRDFTDGVWVWPEGLFHYIDKHEVSLPSEFLVHCREKRWTIPSNAREQIMLSDPLDYTSWIAWAEGSACAEH